MTLPTPFTLNQVGALKVEALYSAKAGLGRTFSDETVLRLIQTIEVMAARLLREAAR